MLLIFFRLDHCVFMAHKHKIRQTPGRSSGPTEWDVILREMKAQLYMHCGTLLIRLAKDVCSLLICLNWYKQKNSSCVFIVYVRALIMCKSKDAVIASYHWAVLHTPVDTRAMYYVSSLLPLFVSYFSLRERGEARLRKERLQRRSCRCFSVARKACTFALHGSHVWLAGSLARTLATLVFSRSLLVVSQCLHVNSSSWLWNGVWITKHRWSSVIMPMLQVKSKFLFPVALIHEKLGLGDKSNWESTYN